MATRYCKFLAEELFTCSYGQRAHPGVHLGFCQITTNFHSDGKRHPWLQTVISVTRKIGRHGSVVKHMTGEANPAVALGVSFSGLDRVYQPSRTGGAIYGLFSALLEIRNFESGKNCKSQLRLTEN